MPSAFAPDPLLRPADLPALPPLIGQVGVMASEISESGPLPPGTDAVLRAPIALEGAGQLTLIAPTSSACTGDSGSGFITAGGGKNFVTGIAALTSDLDCNRPGAELTVTEVWAYLDWIASTAGLHPGPALPTSDVLWRYAGPSGQTSHGQLAIWWDGATTTGPSYPGIVDDAWKIAATGDFDGDGAMDILWRYIGPSGQTLHGQLAIWYASSSDRAAYPAQVADDAWQIKGVGDFDHDGRSDLLWQNTSGQVLLWYGANPSTTLSSGTQSALWQVAGTGDFDGDGASDILWKQTTGTSGLGTLEIWSSGMQVKAVADFNRDGRADLLWRNAAGQVTIWYGGDPATAAVAGTQGSTWEIAGAGDLDGDGFADLLWKSTGGTPAAGTLEIWFNGSNSRTQRPTLTAAQLSYAASHAVQAVADFQGDGTSDVLWRGSDGAISTWSFIGGNVNATTAPKAVDPSWTIQRIADFDGDGRSDIYWRYVGPSGQTNHGQLAIWWSGDNAIAPTYPGLVADDGWQIAGTGSF